MVVIVAGTVRSGTMWTATHAATQGRIVAAVPGRIEDRLSAGPHMLIRNGAVLVENGAQVMELLSSQEREAAAQLSRITESDGAGKMHAGQVAAPDAMGQPVLEWLAEGAKTLEELVERAGLTTAEILGWVTVAEAMGKIRITSGGRYQLI